MPKSIITVISRLDENKMDGNSKKYINIFYFIVFIIIVISFVLYKKFTPTPTLPQGEGARNSILEKNRIDEVKIGNKIYKVEIRDTEEGRREGLSNTSHNYLCDSCGLLFVWESEGERTMWMKDMNYPIDMYWLNKNMQIVHSEYNVATSTYIKNNERSSQLLGKGVYNTQYVLETKVH